MAFNYQTYSFEWFYNKCFDSFIERVGEFITSQFEYND